MACPHCGTVLQTPTEPSRSAAGSFSPGHEDGPETGPDPAADTVRDIAELLGGASLDKLPPEFFRDQTPSGVSAGAAPEISKRNSSVDLDVIPADSAPVIRVSETGSVVVTSAASAATTGAKGETRPAANTPELQRAAEAPQARLESRAPAPVAPVADASGATALAAAIAASPSNLAVSRPLEGVVQLRPAGTIRHTSEPAAEQPHPAGVSPTLFKIVLSYASAVTLACAYLVINRPSTLDLPDIAEPKAKGNKKVTLQYLPPEKQIPATNILHLGESRRFGSVRVTPIRVTRGMVQFLFHDAEQEEERAPEGPVLKLHLRFDNVSRDQDFAPLDRQLVFTRESDSTEYGVFKANNFVCNAGERAKLARHVFAFEASPNDISWRLKDQNLDLEIGPGEWLDTYVATSDEHLDNLSGDLVWRVHFRKGYNRQSFRGVTTLIEVLFKSTDIVDELPPPAATGGKDA